MMDENNTGNQLGRRVFLQSAGALALSASVLKTSSVAAAADVQGAHLMTPSGKPLRGLYPIVETPFTEDNKLDTDLLTAEVKFINRGRIAGMIWPVFASSWSTLSDSERIEGAEAMLAAGKGGKSAIAIAVQNMVWDTATSVRYAKHAAVHGADAIVSIPPNNGWNVSDQAILDYYQAIGAATDLPLIVQTRGTVSVDLMLQMFKQIPTMKATKDEVGNPLERVSALIKGTDNKLAVWAAGGGTGNLLMQELPLGFTGLCPTPQFAEFLQQAMELYWAGKKKEAFDMFARVQAFGALPGATEYMMVLRGVFKESTKSRQQPMEPEAAPAGGARARPAGAAAGSAGAGGGGGGGRGAPVLTDAQKNFLRSAFDDYLKPYTRG